jgi:hypothetical protein
VEFPPEYRRIRKGTAQERDAPVVPYGVQGSRIVRADLINAFDVLNIRGSGKLDLDGGRRRRIGPDLPGTLEIKK